MGWSTRDVSEGLGSTRVSGWLASTREGEFVGWFHQRASEWVVTRVEWSRLSTRGSDLAGSTEVNEWAGLPEGE